MVDSPIGCFTYQMLLLLSAYIVYSITSNHQFIHASTAIQTYIAHKLLNIHTLVIGQMPDYSVHQGHCNIILHKTSIYQMWFHFHAIYRHYSNEMKYSHSSCTLVHLIELLLYIYPLWTFNWFSPEFHIGVGASRLEYHLFSPHPDTRIINSVCSM